MSEVNKTKVETPVLMADPKLIPKTFNFDVPVSSVAWQPPDNPSKGVWYVAMYLGDKAPCILKFERNFWRTAEGTIVSIPMHVIRLPSPPPLKKVKEDK